MKNNTEQMLLIVVIMICGGAATAADSETAKPLDIAAIFGSTSKAIGDPTALLTNVSGRETVSLNGKWSVVVDEHEVGERGIFGGVYYEKNVQKTGMELIEHSFDERRQLTVPGTGIHKMTVSSVTAASYGINIISASPKKRVNAIFYISTVSTTSPMFT